MKPLLLRSLVPDRAWQALFLPLLLSATATVAQYDAPPRPFTVHDTNRDGYLSREEYRVLLQVRRTRSARRPWKAPRPAPAFDEIDLDRDGRITEDELTDVLQRQMYRYHRGPPWR